MIEWESVRGFLRMLCFLSFWSVFILTSNIEAVDELCQPTDCHVAVWQLELNPVGISDDVRWNVSANQCLNLVEFVCPAL
jgi:hypothetical protein